MGCDIHMFVEVRRDGEWQSADKWAPYKYWEESDGTPRLTVNYDDQRYTSRNYVLFAVLADVRNNRVEPRVAPICDPRGLPNDCDPRVKAEADCWEGDAHSHSWLTMAELRGYNWGQSTAPLMRNGDWAPGDTYAEWCSGFLSVLDTLDGLGAPDDVRIVFWFDN